MICIAIISKPKSLSSRLTKWATNSEAMHIGFVDQLNGKFYDQNLLFRRRLWPHYPAENVKLYECPVPLSTKDLEYELDVSEDVYGVFDYCAFALRRLFPKWKPGSYKGVICSEKIELILKAHGWESPFVSTPSPADFEQTLKLIPANTA